MPLSIIGIQIVTHVVKITDHSISASCANSDQFNKKIQIRHLSTHPWMVTSVSLHNYEENLFDEQKASFNFMVFHEKFPI